MEYFIDKFKSLCKYTGIDYISKKSWEDSDYMYSLADLNYIFKISIGSATFMSLTSGIMNLMYICDIYKYQNISNASKLKKTMFGLQAGLTALTIYCTSYHLYNVIKAHKNIKNKIKEFEEQQESQLLDQQSYPIIDNMPTLENGTDDDNNFGHSIFGVIPYDNNYYKLIFSGHWHIYLDSPPFKTKEEAIEFANYILELVNSDDMYDYIKYFYINDIKDIYLKYIKELQISSKYIDNDNNNSNNQPQSIEI